jgi:hypothetical protein
MPLLDLPTFLRMFQMRKSQVMWLLGAGASRAAGIKTADDMIWEFKRKLYCSERKQPLSSISDLGDAGVRRKLQAHFDAKRALPADGNEEEYAAYFEMTYPSARDRRAYIDAEVKLGTPSYGHFGLALLMKTGICHAAWTTNFDRTVEDAAYKVLGGSGSLVVADLGDPQKMRQAWSEGRWPVYGKLHGDYHSERLKNVAEELRNQDAEMRGCLTDACRSKGLALVGYSGRDASIMEALEAALLEGKGFPGGLFWFKRFQDVPYRAARDLIAKARSLGIDAHFVEVETFDELFADILRFLPDTEREAATIAAEIRPRLAKGTSRTSVANTPAIRTNALPVISYPAICRLVVCDIGGWEEIQAAVQTAGADIEAQRTRNGVLAFGSDANIRRVFEPHKITAFDTHAISPNHLAVPAATRILLTISLFRAVGRRPGLVVERRGPRTFLFPNPSLVTASDFNSQAVKAMDRISGSIGTTGIQWSEVCVLRVDFRLQSLWLLLEPRVVLSIPDGTADDAVEVAREFVRERWAIRRNKQANAILDGWIKLIVGEGASIRLRAFEISDGHDAEFEIMRVTGFSGISK